MVVELHHPRLPGMATEAIILSRSWVYRPVLKGRLRKRLSMTRTELHFISF